MDSAYAQPPEQRSSEPASEDENWINSRQITAHLTQRNVRAGESTVRNYSIIARPDTRAKLPYWWKVGPNFGYFVTYMQALRIVDHMTRACGTR